MDLLPRAIDPSDHAFLRELSATMRQGEEAAFLERFAQRPLLAENAKPIGKPVFADNENTLVLRAIHKGWEKALAVLLEAGVNPDLGDPCSCPLHEAASLGRAGCVKLLLARGADPDAKAYPNPPLGLAAWFGHADCCVMLLEAGADPFKLDSDGQTPSQGAREIPDHGPQRPDGAQDAADAIDAWVEAKALGAAAGPAAKAKAKTI